MKQLSVYNLTSINDSPLHSHLLVFTLHPGVVASNLPPFEPNHETLERVVVNELVKKEDMAFPAHWEVLRKWFEDKDGVGVGIGEKKGSL